MPSFTGAPTVSSVKSSGSGSPTRPKGFIEKEGLSPVNGSTSPEATEFGAQPRWSLFLRPQTLDALYGSGRKSKDTSEKDKETKSKKMVSFGSFPTTSSVNSVSSTNGLTPAELKKRRKLLEEGSLAHLQMARLHCHAQL